MVDGVFEGSNDPHFNRKDTLFIIKEFPERLWNVARVNSARSYRYVRYYGPKDSYCNISEVAFYTSFADSVPLKGKIIGTPGCNGLDSSHEYTNVFDGDPYTSFDYVQPTGGWSGLDLGTPRRIEKIVFTPATVIILFVRTMSMNFSIIMMGNGHRQVGSVLIPILCFIRFLKVHCSI